MPALLQPFSRSRKFLISVTCLALCTLPVQASDQPHWLRVSSDHFQVLTDAGPKKGHEIVARFEQMRAVFADLLSRNQVRLAEPIEIIAVATPAEYEKLTPLVNGTPDSTPGIFVRGEDRVFILLNASVPDCWRAIERSFAQYLLDYNYPPTQPWFDEGFAQYFSSLYFTPQKSELGGDPGLTQASGAQTGATQKSFTEILSTYPWMSLPDLLQTKKRAPETNSPGFVAQSWILLHYLVNQNKLSETGTYFGLVENQGVPVPQAVEKAFVMPIAQLESAVKNYFRSQKPLAANLDAARGPNPPAPLPMNELPLPFGIDDVGSNATDVPLPAAQGHVDEMELRIPERRQAAIDDLRNLLENVKTETVVGHRALAWADVQQGDLDDAFKELNSAMQMNPNDPWTRFGLALAAYHSGEKGARVQGLANTMESLHIVIGIYPEFAEAYNILGWARLTGGGANAAVEAMRMAVQLSPRDESYQLRLAEAYVAAKNWNAGNAILERLKASPDPQIAAAADRELYDLPFLQKFGIRPAEKPGSAKQEPNRNKEEVTTDEQALARKQAAKSGDDESESDESETSPPPKLSTPEIDKRPVKFLKGKLLSVDCSQVPTAVLTVLAGKKTLKLRASDYKSLLVMGADNFSCDWKDKPIAVNYRQGGQLDGNLVSIEIQ